MREETLRMEQVTCTQDDINILDNFNLHIFAGEVLGMIFLDDQGKQQIINLFLRNVPLHYGRVYFREELVNSYHYSPMSYNPAALIGSHNPLIDEMTVADNVFVVRNNFKKYVLKPKVLNEQFAAFAQEAGVLLNGSEYVKDLPQYEQYVVQLLKAVILGRRLIIIQDISNLISQVDLEKFHKLIRHFSKQGIAFIYICSHHEEAFTICGRISVIENGQVQKNLLLQDEQTFDKTFFDKHMLHIENANNPADNPVRHNCVLKFNCVQTPVLKDATFEVAKGECLVMLDTSNTALDDIFGVLACGILPLGGSVHLNGSPYPQKRHQQNFPVGLIQQSPSKTMLFYDFSYLDNLCFSAGQRQPQLWRGRAIRKSVRREYYPLIGADIDAQDISGLSMSSLYSLVYYSQHLFNPSLVVIKQPFFEADMYLRRHIIFLINQLLERGISILILAVNISDTLLVADRMLLIHDGRITHEFGKADMESLNRRKTLGKG